MLKPGDYVAPTGKLLVGSVLDCNKDSLERSLKFYDKQLYLKWNPKKRGGWGMWEVRRQPEFLTPVYQGSFNGARLYTAEYKETDIVHHVLDVPVLSYDLLGKLKAMDTWNQKHFLDSHEYEAARRVEQQEKATRAELRYNVKQFKREWKELASLVSQGVNPAHLLKGIRG